MRFNFVGSRLLILSLVVLLAASCSNDTDNPDRSVVKVRNGIMDLVDGKTSEVTGSSKNGESYILLDGSMSEDSFSSLAISKRLQSDLAGISPPDEKYVLARIVNNRVSEYTFFPHGWPRDPLDARHPRLIRPCPLIVTGNSFKITKERETSAETIIKVQN